MLVGTVLATAVAAAGPEDDLRAANLGVRRALVAARAGDLGTAEREYRGYESTWFQIEDGIRDRSRDAYRIIERLMGGVDAALARRPADAAAVVAALSALDRAQTQFVNGEVVVDPSGAAAPQPGSATKPTVTTLLRALADARAAAASGNWTGAATEIAQFQDTWLDVEGEIKTRSAEAYRQSEIDMALAATQAAQHSPETAATLGRMTERLRPFEAAAHYGVFDAAIILLREGLEAILVLVALSTFLLKSGNGDKRRWVWSGAAAGLAASVALGVALQVLVSGLITAENRELIEGITGLFAAAMLLYVSYWLHDKSSLAGWRRYVTERTTAALTSGGLFGLALLAFLAVFREGGETVLFYLGMAASITTTDLLAGLAIGAAGLAAVTVLMTVAGVRVPMRPFFTVASILVFYLCFKFVGTGVHALQVAGILGSSSAGYLPALDFFGMYPTWATTIPQVLLVLAGAAVILRGRLAMRLAPAQNA
ncbi:MAG: high-affinity iron transporter [Chloroflexota bacterium]|jgi:high-affinity iron transporter|nr:high-affinity iron transporter [Chloroflexota bacterium]